MREYITIYPDVEVGGAQRLYTNIRKNFDGVWYLIPIIKQNLGVPIEVALNQFHKEVYNCLICSEYTTNLKDIYEQPLFKRDPNQEDEKERIKKQYRVV